ncbi:MAG: FAD-binding protein, partial [Candidatus Omnitrophota bacterium]
MEIPKGTNKLWIWLTEVSQRDLLVKVFAGLMKISEDESRKIIRGLTEKDRPGELEKTLREKIELYADDGGQAQAARDRNLLMITAYLEVEKADEYIGGEKYPLPHAFLGRWSRSGLQIAQENDAEICRGLCGTPFLDGMVNPINMNRRISGDKDGGRNNEQVEALFGFLRYYMAGCVNPGVDPAETAKVNRDGGKKIDSQVAVILSLLWHYGLLNEGEKIPEMITPEDFLALKSLYMKDRSFYIRRYAEAHGFGERNISTVIGLLRDTLNRDSSDGAFIYGLINVDDSKDIPFKTLRPEDKNLSVSPALLAFIGLFEIYRLGRGRSIFIRQGSIRRDLIEMYWPATDAVVAACDGNENKPVLESAVDGGSDGGAGEITGSIYSVKRDKGIYDVPAGEFTDADGGISKGNKKDILFGRQGYFDILRLNQEIIPGDGRDIPVKRIFEGMLPDERNLPVEFYCLTEQPARAPPVFSAVEVTEGNARVFFSSQAYELFTAFFNPAELQTVLKAFSIYAGALNTAQSRQNAVEAYLQYLSSYPNINRKLSVIVNSEIRRTGILSLGRGGASLGFVVEMLEANPDVSITIAFKGGESEDIEESANTPRAQGGAAVNMPDELKEQPEGEKKDSPQHHAIDTILIGDLFNKLSVVRDYVCGFPLRLEKLVERGANFDMKKSKNGKKEVLNVSREGGYSGISRILKADGAATGREIQRTLTENVDDLIREGRNIQKVENFFVLDLLTKDTAGGEKEVLGAVGLDLSSGKFIFYLAEKTVVGMGGGGRVFPRTTNSPAATGDGHAVLLRAGAKLTNMHF